MRNIKVILTSILIAATLFFIMAVGAQAQVVPAQNQIIPSAYFGQGYLISTSSSPTHKLGATLVDLAGSFITGILSAIHGGTGTSSPSGILYGDNGATSHLNTVTIGAGLSFSGGTLSSTISGGNSKWATSTDTTSIYPNSATKVGVATTSPWAQFSIGMASTTPALVVGVAGSSTPSLYVAPANSNGYVGIGTNNPVSPLEVDSATNPYLTIGGIVDGTTYAFAENDFALVNRAATTPVKNIWAMGAEGKYSNAGTVSAQDFYFYDSVTSRYNISINGSDDIGLGGTTIPGSGVLTGAAVYVDHGGKVGIGTTTPANLVDVYGGILSVTNTANGAAGSRMLTLTNLSNGTAARSAISLQSSTGVHSLELAFAGSGNTTTNFGTTNASYGLLLSQTTTSGLKVGTLKTGAPLIFGTEDSEVARFDGSGNLGIGTTTPTNPLTLAAGSVTTPALSFGDTGTGLYRSASNALTFATNGNVGPAITTSGIALGGVSFVYHSASINNASINFSAIGTKINRNIGDSSTALVVNQQNAGSTGDILDLLANSATTTVFTQAGNLGVGTTSPSAQLAVGMASTTSAFVVGVAGSSTPAFSVASANSNGAVNVGTTLTVGGVLTTNGGIALGAQVVSGGNNISANNTSGYILIGGATSGTVPSLVPNRTSTNTGIGADAATNLSFITSGTTKLELLNGGNFGVGTTSPYKLLSIGGDIVVGASAAGGTLGDLYLPKLGTAAGAFLAIDAAGKVIATTTPSGGSGTVTSVGLSDSNSTLTIGGTPVTTSGTLTATLNLAHANIWTGQQTFNTSAPILGTITGSTQCLQVDTSGLVSGTGSTCGSGGTTFGQSFEVDSSSWLSATTTNTFGISANTSGVTYGYGIGGKLFAYASSTNNTVVLGIGAGNIATTSSLFTQNVFIGNKAGSGATSNFSNSVVIGYNAGGKLNSGSNIIIGAGAVTTTLIGGNNVIIGDGITGTATAANQIIIGHSAGGGVGITGTGDILIGSGISGPSLGSAAGGLDIQNMIYGLGNTATGATVSSGEVGIGTSSPYATFSIGMASTTNAFVVGVAGSSTPSLIVSSANTSGKVGIATTTPTTAFSVEGSVTFHGLTTGAGNGALCASTAGLVSYDAGANCITSSERFKNDIEGVSASSSLAEVLKLQPVSFYYKSAYGDGGQNEWVGFIAEQVAKVDKRFVQYDANGDGKPYSVYYQNITALLTGAVQQISHRQDVQQQEIDQLKVEVAQLQAGQQGIKMCKVPL